MHDFYGVALGNRLILGTPLYPSPAILAEAVRVAGVQAATVSLRRESAARRDAQAFWALLRELGLSVLPNSAGCHTLHEALTTAPPPRAACDPPWRNRAELAQPR